MSLLQIAAPDLTSLAYGGATLQLLEGLGFSQDRATLLVRATFTDDADGGGTPHYAMWTYDLVQRQYTACLNALLTPAGGYPADTEVTSALIVGAGSQQTVVVESALRGTVSGSSLSLLTAGVVTDANVLFSVLGPDIALRIERYSLSQDGRFLALQTDSNLLAPDAAPDGNDVSDIYLLDLLTHQTQRVSFVANTEVYAPVQLGNIYSDGAQVQVAFSSAAAFVTADKNSTALTTEAQTDAYVWRSSFDAAGLTGAPTFQLVSARTDGTAAGFVGGDVDVLATASGVYFSSASAELVANDNNAAMDVFSVSNGGLVERVAISGFDELANGAGLVSASSDGRVLGLLTSSEEVAGPDNLQQLLVIDTQSAIWRVASSVSATVLANDIVLNGVLTPDGRSIAFTSSADNLVSGLPPALAGSLYVTLTEVIPNNLPTGSVTIGGTATATQGQTRTATNTLADVDGIPASGVGAISYQWQAGGVDIAGATGSTYVLSQAEVGKAMTVVASYTDGYGAAESRTSSATEAVANLNDLPTGTVTISGTATQGQTLKVANTLADLDGIPTTGAGAISYQWKVDGADISGATGHTLVLNTVGVGQVISVLASYTDNFGNAEKLLSNAMQVSVNLGREVDFLTYSWKSHTLLDGVSISGAGQTVSSSSGAASFTGVIDTNLLLAATRPIPTTEAVATSSAVNLQDAIAILKMIVGLDVNGAGKALSPYQALAADFDGSGAVGLTDAIGVLKHVVGLSAPDPAWHFANESDLAVPAITPAGSVALPAINVMLDTAGPVHVGLVGYLSGDVDGSYAGRAGALDLDTTQPNYFVGLVGAHPELTMAQFGVYA